MAPRVKYDDIPIEKVSFNGKVFMYTTPGWEILFPVVDIIRLFKENTVISYKYGKGQQIIRTYGTQYNHRVTGYDIKCKQDYTDALKSVKCIFVFTDTADNFAENFITFAKTLKILLVCYSNLDHVYHFYDYFSDKPKMILQKAEQVIEQIYYIYEEVKVTKIAEMFPDFEIIEAPEEEPKETVLEECLRKLKITDAQEKKKKESNLIKKVKDVNLTRIKLMENSRKKVVYDDEPKSVNIFSKFK